MNKRNESLLAVIWDTIQMLDTAPGNEETEITSKIERVDGNLLDSLNDEQKNLFQSYEGLLYEFNLACQKEAFIKGIKFATQFFLEATEK